jgi:hypothetical protein
MRVDDITDNVQEQVLSIVHIARSNVVGALEFLGEQTQRLVPQAATRITDRLPRPAKVVDQGFKSTEDFLRRRFN